MGKVRFSILEKPPDRILREDMKFKGIAPLRLTIRPLGGKVGGASGAAVLYVVVREASLTLAP